jgi:diguanylate cyclase (GGDEF)-like protein
MPLASLLGQRLGARWLYMLAVAPVLTDIIETGGWPKAPREWFTEVAVGLLIAALVRQVRKEHQAVLALSLSDALTGLGNRRAFAEALESECARARRSRQPLALIYIDLDHFKQVNDRDGHAQGDMVLRQLAAAISDVVRSRVDRGFRVGGDEFVVTLPGSTAAAAEVVLTRIRQQCADQGGAWACAPLAISGGVAEFDGQESADVFVRRADAAMYGRKAAGRHGRAQYSVSTSLASR